VGIPVIEQAKIQAQVLVPLVKALQAELGEERERTCPQGSRRCLSSPRRTVVAGESIQACGRQHGVGVCLVRERSRPRL
jgi:hypothetical protein